nr:MAG TPA: hypothetical protein [Microviridae sp.]
MIIISCACARDYVCARACHYKIKYSAKYLT